MKASTSEQALQSEQVAPPSEEARALHLHRIFRLESLRHNGAIRVRAISREGDDRRQSPQLHCGVATRASAPIQPGALALAQGNISAQKVPD